MSTETIETAVVVPQNPEDQKKIRGILEQVSSIMTVISLKRDEIKENKKILVEEYKIPPKLANRMCKTFHADSFPKETAIDETFSVLYETVTGQKADDSK
jgi:hypothetical protein